jgi:dihydropteroate synthase
MTTAPGILQTGLPPGPGFLLGRSCRIELDRPRIMGVLNVTPDSFSDGGAFVAVDAALARARQLAEEGADLIDIGGESTRPGAPPVGFEEELDRVLPVIEALRREIAVPLSIDTTKSAVATAAVAAGVEFVNDVSGLSFDPAMAGAVAATGAGLIVMHTRGRPETMQVDTRYADVVDEVREALRRSVTGAMTAGVSAERIAIDPGIGFGKDLPGNLELLRRLNEFSVLGRPILLGTSRKSFIGRVLGQTDPLQRQAGTLATVVLGVAGGARLLRVHEVRPAREAALMAWAVCQGAGWQG